MVLYIYVKCISLFYYYLPLEKGVALNLNKFESPSPKEAICQIWLKFALWFWIWRFLNFTNIFFAISILSPFRELNGSFTTLLLSPIGKGWGPSFERTWIPFSQGCFVPSLVKIGPVFLEKKMKKWKVYDNNNDDNGPQTNCDRKSSLRLRWTKNVK